MSPRKLRRKENRIDEVPWTFLKRVEMEKAEGWQEIVLDEPVEAGCADGLAGEFRNAPPWTETSEIKIYP